MTSEEQTPLEALEYIDELCAAAIFPDPLGMLREIQRAARAALSQAAPVGDGAGTWRPIESAPKDGTHIILAFGQDHASEGWYVDDDNDPRPWRFIDIGDFNKAIINSSRDGEYGPSHWQPMPHREPRNRPEPGDTTAALHLPPSEGDGPKNLCGSPSASRGTGEGDAMPSEGR